MAEESKIGADYGIDREKLIAEAAKHLNADLQGQSNGEETPIEA